ncbi:hypothetical protein PEPS_30070 (plasmid) [Persicobacter psychrovividus]|uniref:Uncharacterized protein n=1 Tax=Persicobacter psychrovividus TaxID=387638 RepID=A0ABM7VIB8_9BACT|nr:hypothetical protein PEPS_30070 [Persicobacter psychrovividus]
MSLNLAVDTEISAVGSGRVIYTGAVQMYLRGLFALG